ncbi:hypothetical protein BV898_05947 [Hypsibius exemplaris]|uniref:Uncharacterized protein n=1 Tax=Hypsibius exemplaris TaxID=2072580 RepID=A0A1W0WXK9_HYPEX|nr:hypothetical protein BV898_05947 [Hypsibius exemplaris]
MADHVAVLQTGTLAFLGFLQKRQRPLSTLAESCGAWIRTTVAAAIVVGSMVCFGIDSAKAVKSMIDDTMHPFLVTAFLYSPFCLLDLRPVYVLAMLLYNRRNFEKLTTAANEFIADSVFLSAPHSQASSWTFRMTFRMKSKLWFLLSGTMILLSYGFFQWMKYSRWLERHRGDDTTDTFWMTNLLEPLPPFLPAWQNIILWSLFSIFPLILSQQVIGIFVLNADFLKEGLRDLNRDIREQSESFGPCRDAKRALNLGSRIMLWIRLVRLQSVLRRAKRLFWDDCFWSLRRGLSGTRGIGDSHDFMPFMGFETLALLVYDILMIVTFMTLFLYPLPWLTKRVLASVRTCKTSSIVGLQSNRRRSRETLAMGAPLVALTKLDGPGLGLITRIFVSSDDH